MIAALTSAFTFGTVVPLTRGGGAPRGSTVTALPVVGVALGLAAAAALWTGTQAFGSHNLLTGLLTVTALLVLTRGIHLDGLADTADGLGCYGPPERALSVMRDGPTGPFGVAAVVIAVTTQAAAFAALPSGAAGTAAAVAAVAAGRVAAVAACRRGVPAAAGSSLGALVAGSQSRPVLIGWAVVVAGLSIPATPRLWQGPLVVAITLLLAATLIAHCVRRFGGITGDVMGAAVELTTTLTVVGLAIQP